MHLIEAVGVVAAGDLVELGSHVGGTHRDGLLHIRWRHPACRDARIPCRAAPPRAIFKSQPQKPRQLERNSRARSATRLISYSYVSDLYGCSHQLHAVFQWAREQCALIMPCAQQGQWMGGCARTCCNNHGDALGDEADDGLQMPHTVL